MTITSDTTLDDLSRAVPMILNAARLGCLPMPTRVETSACDAGSSLTFVVTTADDLYAWATWLDEPIDREHVDGELYDQPLRVQLSAVAHA